MKKSVRAVALAGVVALTLAACGDEPDDSAGPSGPAGTSDFKACMVSDSGGFDDKSFNESGFDGLTAAQDALGIETASAESQAESDFAPNIDNLVSEGCDIVVTVGFLLATATGDAAQANPDVEFAIVDSTASDAEGNPVELENVQPISFDTAQAAYLAGYLAAGMTETGKVATFGGIQIPSVAIFMDGFADGVARYNEVKGTSVELLGWDKAAQNGSFVGNFEDAAKGQSLTEEFIAQGADIILPVAGPVGSGSLTAAQDAGGSVKVIWVDSDGAETNPDASAVILTSVLKGIGAAVEDVITAAEAGEFSNEPYVGTLENEGVALAPFHDFEDAVPADLAAEVDQLKADIIAGDIVVESPNAP